MNTLLPRFSLALMLALLPLHQSATAAEADAQAKAKAGSSVLAAGGLKAVRQHVGPDNGKYGEMQIAKVTGQPFAEALRVKVKERPAEPWHVQLSHPLAVPVKRGDVVLISFRVRAVESKNPGGRGLISLYFGAPETSLEVTVAQEITVGKEWTLVQVPAEVTDDYEPGKGMLNLDVGHEPQVLEVADVQLLNYGRKAKVSELPQSGQ